MFRGFFDDPFFNGNMFNSSPFFGNSHNNPAIEPGYEQRSGRGRRDVAVSDPFQQMGNSHNPFDGFGMMSMMSDPFSMMERMHQNMNNMMSHSMSQAFTSSGEENNDGFGFSSVKVSSYVDDGSGNPKFYEASKSTKSAPGGMKEVQKSVRDSEAGLEKMSVGRHIKDRGHVITRERNTRTGDMSQDQQFDGFDEDEAPQFDAEWQGRLGKHSKRSNQKAIKHKKQKHERPAIEE